MFVDSPKQKKSNASNAIGIDLGLKDIATCSDGTVISNSQYYRKYEQKLGIAQSAMNKKRVRALHAKIKNCRKDHLHKASSMLVKNNALIVMGDLSAQKLVKTKMAKSVLDTGFSRLRTMLKYTCENATCAALLLRYEEVSEHFTPQVCSSCGEITASSPKGRAGLRIREWRCCNEKCLSLNDRDINAALNILLTERCSSGHEHLAGGISVL